MAAGSINSLKSEMAAQTARLGNILLPKPARHPVFIGSGDSYAACLLAVAVCGGHSQALVPSQAMTLAESAALDKRSPVFIASVSGKTKDNILTAKMLKSQGFKVTAVTSDPSSPLAKACGRSIELETEGRQKVPTAGTLSFLTTFLKCSALCAPLTLPPIPEALFGKAKKRAGRIINLLGSQEWSCFYFLGDSITYPVALYGALKVNEILGEKAFAYDTREFTHAPLFSVKSNDAVICIDTTKEGDRLSKRLRKIGMSAVFSDCSGVNALESALIAVFTAQLVVLELATQRGIDECFFLSDKEMLRLSSDLIY
ncbi:MAG: SIS domain-containing protein [Nitrososphaera sp.]